MCIPWEMAAAKLLVGAGAGKYMVGRRTLWLLYFPHLLLV